DRNDDLVVVAIRHPALELLAGELAGVHAHVERVEMVVARALRAKGVDEFVGRERGLIGSGLEGARHSVISIPSCATWMPVPATIARSSESSRRIGFVLFTCTRTVLAGSVWRVARLPSGPESGMWPMASASRSARPSETSSSAVQKVPSTKTT